MKLKFLGATETVTGSKHLLLTTKGKQYLLDCGLYQGKGSDNYQLNSHLGLDPAKIDAVILSHAHVDHSGLLPYLCKSGFNGKIYCTPPTLDLCKILLQDSAHIQENDIHYINKKREKKGEEPLKPLYNIKDAEHALKQFKTIPYHTKFRLCDEVELTFTDAGHIIGSAAVHLRITENGKKTTLTFSGDVGRYRDIILKSPAVFEQSDYILLESTYGNSLHDEHHSSTDTLLKWIEHTCLKKQGKLIIPAFSVGRTQEILYSLNQLELENKLPKLEYFVDSPLSTKATQIIKSYPQYFNSRIQKVLQSDSDPFEFKGLKFVKTVDESKMLNYYKNPCVIISASGMAEAGRVKHHISNNIENSKNTILLTGYCEPHSLGGKLMRKPKEINIFGQPHEVNAEIAEMRSMSAHGDYDDLCQFLACQEPRAVKKLFLVHGEYPVQLDFKNRLVRKGFLDVEIPSRHEVIGLG